MEQKTKYKLILFDLDGTLLHTAPDVHVSINAALAKMNLALLPYEKSLKAIGPGAERFIHTVLGNENQHRLREFIETFQPIYRKNCVVKTQPFSGIIDLLHSLRDLDMAVITNKALETSTFILNHLQFLRYFKLVVGPELVEKIKPAPDMINYCLQHFRTNAEEALVVGDTDNDILAAQAAGVDVCVVGWGYGETQELLSYHPTYLIHTPNELKGIIFDDTKKSLEI